MHITEWLARNDKGGQVAAMVGVRPVPMALHPEHHQTCFCPVCRGEADGHVSDPCQCGRCR